MSYSVSKGCLQTGLFSVVICIKRFQSQTTGKVLPRGRILRKLGCQELPKAPPWQIREARPVRPGQGSGECGLYLDLRSWRVALPGLFWAGIQDYFAPNWNTSQPMIVCPLYLPMYYSFIYIYLYMYYVSIFHGEYLVTHIRLHMWGVYVCLYIVWGSLRLRR